MKFYNSRDFGIVEILFPKKTHKKGKKDVSNLQTVDSLATLCFAVTDSSWLLLVDVVCWWYPVIIYTYYGEPFALKRISADDNENVFLSEGMQFFWYYSIGAERSTVESMLGGYLHEYADSRSSTSLSEAIIYLSADYRPLLGFDIEKYPLKQGE